MDDATQRTPARGKPRPPLPEEPRRRLSALRVLIALVVLVASGSGVALAVRGGKIGPRSGAGTVKGGPTFAPYVDVTLTPPYAFQDRSASPGRALVLGFVVSSPDNPCTPSWGGFYGLDQAAKALDLDRRIAQTQGQGSRVIASFGGQANRELALGCKKPAALESAYQSVIDRYHLSGLDFDIEGTAVNDVASTERRAKALRALQRQRRHPLSVWLTLPVAPEGLLPGAIDNVRRTLAAGVSLAGVNLLAMDYGPPEKNMLAVSRKALRTAHSQLSAVYASARVRVSSAQLWNRMGATIQLYRDCLGGTPCRWGRRPRRVCS